MLPVPIPILTRYEAILEKRAVSLRQRGDYKKWLRYFLDFLSKHPAPETRSEQVRLFIDKLREKKQTPAQQKQAAHAVSLLGIEKGIIDPFQRLHSAPFFTISRTCRGPTPAHKLRKTGGLF